MNKYLLILTSLFFILFTISCHDKKDGITDNSLSSYDSKDIFSNKDINFKNLELEEDNNSIKNTNEYSVTNVGVRFSPPINCIRLSDKEKEDIISQTGYGKDYFYTDSMFIDEKIKITCLAAYMKKDDSSLDNFISFIRAMKNGNNFTEEYYIINGRKNIQFKINMDNNTFLLYTIFESKNDYYFILNYTFPVSYLQDSVIRIGNSLNSVRF